MSEPSNDLNHPILNLTEQEKRAFSFLFNQADSDQLGVVTGERAVAFFERTKVSPNVLGEIWQIADTENRGLLTKPGFCMVLRLIGHYQAGREPSTELAFKAGPIPKFEGLQIPGVSSGPGGPAQSPTVGGFPPNALQPQLSGPIRVPPLDAQKVQQYSGLFERSGAQNGMLDGVTAKNIFERAGLPNEVLGKIWTLADREQRGALDQTEFIVAMHLLTSMKSRTMTALPNTLPPGLYEAAARRGIPAPPGSRGGPVVPGAVPRQFTGGSVGAPPRTQSPLARSPAYTAPPSQPAQPAGLPWLITPQEKAKYDQFFQSIDTQGRGVLTGEQAVGFFSDSRLPEDTLATIWDLADINSAGQLSRDEFAVAMYLIRQQRAPNPPPLPAFLPPALVPPSMRQQQQQAQSTAPAFDNASNQHNLPKSAADDLFGLDEPSSAQSQQPLQPQASGFQSPQTTGLQAQTTGTSTSRDPFGGSAPGSPSSPQRFQPQQTGTMFKPFMPTSAFGASLAQQHTGGSTASSQGQPPRGIQPQPSHLQQASAMDDLLGDNDTHAEESSKLTNETTELANMSNQIGNLRTQMEQTQSKKATTQADLTATNNQKRDLELRLQQFRSQYEQEVRAVKELESQLTASRESTKKLSQDLAMLEGTYQDLQTQHTTIAQALQADQQENATLKERMSQVNAEVTRLKPEIEKMKLDARQQKGLVSINKKQLATNENERDRLQSEKVDLEREATEREEQARNAPQEEQQSHFGRDAAVGAGVGAAAFGAYEATKDRQGSRGGSTVTSPSGLSSTNPFFRKASGEGTAERGMSPPPGSFSGPTPSAFDALFGPSAAFAPTGQAGSRTGTPPTTSFIGRNISGPGESGNAQQTAQPQQMMSDSVQSMSSVGEPTPSATPPLSEKAKESPIAGNDQQPPPPPENRQFTPSQLPIGGLRERSKDEDDVNSTRAMPPASRAGGMETPREGSDSRVASPVPPSSAFGAFSPPVEDVPGAFPSGDEQPGSSTREVPPEAAEPPQATGDDFDSAFAGFGDGNKTKEAQRNEDDPFAPSASQSRGQGFSSEFPPIQNLEPEDEEDSEDEDEQERGGFDDDFTGANQTRDAVEQQHGAAELSPLATPAQSHAQAEPEANIAGARPAVTAVESTASDLPKITAQTSPPTYEESNEPSHGGSGERPQSNQFPPEFGGLLPARENPTSSPPPTIEPEQVVPQEQQTAYRPAAFQIPERSGTGSSSLYAGAQTPSSSDVFHDASSRPISSVTDASPPQAQQQSTLGPAAPPQAKNAFDDFDEFGDLSEAKEADHEEGNGLDFGFGRQSTTDHDFSPTFDSPAASMTNTMTSSQQTPVPSNRQIGDSNGFANFQPNASSTNAFGDPSGSVQNTPQNVQHDWDAIFSGLDSSKGVDTSLSGPGHEDPWGSPAPAANGAPASENTIPTPTAAKAAQMGRAITPGTEHDDPILKRLTAMGYPRADALNALERYDYDIDKAVDHLAGN